MSSPYYFRTAGARYSEEDRNITTLALTGFENEMPLSAMDFDRHVDDDERDGFPTITVYFHTVVSQCYSNRFNWLMESDDMSWASESRSS